jgi:hypothetical protein
MTQARRDLVSPETTPYYHCICRCVRRAFLCGEDHLTGRNYDHRKTWVVERLKQLSDLFAIDVCAYAVMSNHYHVVLRLNAEQAAAWDDEDVIRRWSRLFGLPTLIARYQRGETGPAENSKARELLQTWRERLTDLSWFMRCLNEGLARQANAEDGCKGRFWEGRFKSQALLDEAALLTCMAYVDLNPVRAGIADTPETSDFTAIQQRIRAWSTEKKARESTESTTQPALLPFRGPEHQDAPDGLPFAKADYLALVDWTGRAIREDKRGHIPNDLPPILERLGIAPEAYLRHMKRPTNPFVHVIGRVEAIREAAEAAGRRFLKGVAEARALFPTASS